MRMVICWRVPFLVFVYGALWLQKFYLILQQTNISLKFSILLLNIKGDKINFNCIILDILGSDCKFHDDKSVHIFSG